MLHAFGGYTIRQTKGFNKPRACMRTCLCIILTVGIFTQLEPLFDNISISRSPYLLEFLNAAVTDELASCVHPAFFGGSPLLRYRPNQATVVNQDRRVGQLSNSGSSLTKPLVATCTKLPPWERLVTEIQVNTMKKFAPQSKIPTTAVLIGYPIMDKLSGRIGKRAGHQVALCSQAILQKNYSLPVPWEHWQHTMLMCGWHPTSPPLYGSQRNTTYASVSKTQDTILRVVRSDLTRWPFGLTT